MARVEHAIYGSPALLGRFWADTPLGELPWVAYDLAVFRGIDTYLARAWPRARVAMRVRRIDLLMSALESGVGVGVLQCVALGSVLSAELRPEDTPPSPESPCCEWASGSP